METNKPIKFKIKLSGGKNSVIPAGAIEHLTVEIIDNAAVFHFIDSKTTLAFAKTQKNDGIESFYSERLKKTFCKYPNTKKEDILKHLTTKIKQLESNK